MLAIQEQTRHSEIPARSQIGFVSSSISDRQVFAEQNRRSRTAYRACREKAGLMRADAKEVRSLQSGLSSRNREKWAEFASFERNEGTNSLQFRLHGGEGGIVLAANSKITLKMQKSIDPPAIAVV